MLRNYKSNNDEQPQQMVFQQSFKSKGDESLLEGNESIIYSLTDL